MVIIKIILMWNGCEYIYLPNTLYSLCVRACELHYIQSCWMTMNAEYSESQLKSTCIYSLGKRERERERERLVVFVCVYVQCTLYNIQYNSSQENLCCYIIIIIADNYNCYSIETKTYINKQTNKLTTDYQNMTNNIYIYI